MAADSQGNDILAVQVPLTGQVYIADEGTTAPDIHTSTVTLDAGFDPLGLLKQDGGPEWAKTQDGDNIEFWQDGYLLPGVNVYYTLNVNAAEDNPVVNKLVLGVEPDVNGVYHVDGAIAPVIYLVYVSEVFKSGRIRRRLCTNAKVTEVAEDRSTRGEVKGYAITLRIDRDNTTTPPEHFSQFMKLPA